MVIADQAPGEVQQFPDGAPANAGPRLEGCPVGPSVNGSALTGRFVRTRAVSRSSATTTTERIGSGTGNSRTVYRSASTGRFVTPATAARHPSTTIKQAV
jgi:hypothetical protein